MGRMRPSADPEAPAQAFEWIADADSRLGPVLEAIVNGRYYWVPFRNIRSIQVEKPTDLRDLVWMPAHLAWANGGEAVGMIPTRYPGSETSLDNQIRMARKTEWTDLGGDMCAGQGQRMIATDAGTVKEVRVEVGQMVDPDTVMIIVDAEV